MTTSCAPRLTTDSWSLRIMAEAKAYRDETGEPIPELDAYYADCLAAVAEVGITRDEDTTATPAPRRPGSGASNYATPARNAATPAQLGFIAKLEAQLGETLEAPRDKAHASRIIDAAKRALTARPATARPARTATPGQVGFLTDLLATRTHDLGEIDPAGLAFDEASAMITALLATPRATAAKPAHGIAEGHYAHRDDEGVAHFYRVTDTGRIRVIAGPSEHPYNGKLNEALLWIAANLRDAAALYGQLIGRCGRCHRRLSDDDSIKRGLGPFCASKY